MKLIDFISPLAKAVVLAILVQAAMPLNYVLADCTPDLTTNITCTGTDTNGTTGTAGNDTITVNSGATVSKTTAPATINGNGGTDKVINNGTVSSSAALPVSSAVRIDSGTVTNNGTIATTNNNGVNVIGSNATVTNNGNIVAGNNAVQSLSLGGNTIVNNGTLSGKTAVSLIGGASDSVTLNGGSTTTGSNGTAVSMGIGADTVVVKSGATVNGGINTGLGNDKVTVEGGSKVNGVINGGAGVDTLILVVDDDTDLSGLNPASGSLTFAGQVYTWINFEQLVKMILERAAGGGGPSGPQIFFVNDNIVGMMANNALSIEVIGKPGLIARLFFAELKALAKGESARFEEPNSNGWFILVINKGPYHLNPSWTYYQVNLYDGSGNLVSDQQGFTLENK